MRRIKNFPEFELETILPGELPHEQFVHNQLKSFFQQAPGYSSEFYELHWKDFPHGFVEFRLILIDLVAEAFHIIGGLPNNSWRPNDSARMMKWFWFLKRYYEKRNLHFEWVQHFIVACDRYSPHRHSPHRCKII
jgi:hypothetical protein